MHNYKECNKKSNPFQGQFTGLIISLFYNNVDIFDCAYIFIHSITFQQNDTQEISGKIPINYNRVNFA